MEYKRSSTGRVRGTGIFWGSFTPVDQVDTSITRVYVESTKNDLPERIEVEVKV
jgi:hypothetical protein